MNQTSSPLADGALSLGDLRALGVKPHNIDSNWMDDMTKRLFDELKRELSQLETAKPTTEFDKKDATTRALNAKTLDSLQRTLERLNRMEAQRADRRAIKGSLTPEEAREQLRPQIVEIFARVVGRRVAEGAE